MEVTVITASYNCAAYIGETLNSLSAQTYKNWQAIIFDDGSTDGSIDIIKTFTDKNKNMRLLRHNGNGNKGLPVTLKKALDCVKTEYVAFLECDDAWHPDYLKEKVNILRKNKGVKIIFNDITPYGNGKRAKQLSLYYKAVNLYLKILNPAGSNYNLVLPLLTFNPVPSFSCVLLEAKLLEQADFKTPFAPWLDRWLWAQLALKNKFYFLPRKLTKWRLHDKSFTAASAKDIKPNRKKFEERIKSLYKAGLPQGKFLTLKAASSAARIFYIIFITPLKLLLKLFIR